MKTKFRHLTIPIWAVCTCFVATAAIGCRTDASTMVGRWADKMGTVMMLNYDGSFVEGEGQSASGGTWTISGKDVTLSVTTIGGLPIDKAFDQMSRMSGPAAPTQDQLATRDKIKHMSFKLSDDRMHMTLLVPGREPDPEKDIVFTRAEK
jgi:hypothetical protein